MWLPGKDPVGLEVGGVPVLDLCLRMGKKRMMTMKIVMTDFESERKQKLPYLMWERGCLLVPIPNLISIGTPKETRQKSGIAAAESAGYRTYLGSSKLHLLSLFAFYRSDWRHRQHLYRVHSRPDYYCPRCYEVFESSSLLDVHVRQANSCTVIDCPYPEKLTDEQMKALKRKWPGKSMEECWYIIFRILFPNTPVPSNPCKILYFLSHGLH